MIQDRWSFIDYLSKMKGFRMEEEMTQKLHTIPTASNTYSSTSYLSSHHRTNINTPIYPVISPNFPCYRNLDGSYQTMEFLELEYPHLVEVINIGPSYLKSINSGGHEMKVLKLTNKNTSTTNNPTTTTTTTTTTVSKAPLFILCGIHPRELVPTEVCARFAEDILYNYQRDADKTWILDYTEIHIILQANPDGRQDEELNLRFRRKNMHIHVKKLGFSCFSKTRNGVDMNRNFPHSKWGTESSKLPCKATYHGYSAGSEMETQAIVKYLESVLPPGTNRKNANTGAYESDSKGVLMDLHSFGRDFFWPWAFTDDILAPNAVDLTAFAKKMASQTNPRYSSNNDVYNTSGDTTDYAYEAIGVAAYTAEIGTAFHEDCSTFEHTILRNTEKFLLYASRVSMYPYLLPKGPDLLISLSTSIIKNDENLLVTVHASDSLYAMEYVTGQQTLVVINLYIDTHPYEIRAAPDFQVEDNFDSNKATVEFNLPLSNLSQGKHHLFIQAYDTQGPGPVYSEFVQII